MTCDQAKELIIDLDAHETPSPQLTRHIAECPRCRALFVKLTRLQVAARISSTTGATPWRGDDTKRIGQRVDEVGSPIQPAPAATEGAGRLGGESDIEVAATAGENEIYSAANTASDFTHRVMSAVHREAASSNDLDPKLSLGGWAVGGAVIIAGLVLVQFNRVVDWLRGFFGSTLDVALAMFFGIAVTIYLLMLVGSNLKAVRRFWRRVAR